MQYSAARKGALVAAVMVLLALRSVTGAGRDDHIDESFDLDIAFLEAAEEASKSSTIPTDTCLRPEQCGAIYSAGYVHDTYYSGLRRVTRNAHSQWCLRSIEFEYMKHVRAIAEESPFPFENILYRTQCPTAGEHTPLTPVIKTGYITLGEDSGEYRAPERPAAPISSKVGDDPASDSSGADSSGADSGGAKNAAEVDGAVVAAPIPPEQLSILYVVLVHDHPEFVVRILDALDEPHLHNFVIHVDAKANHLYEHLVTHLARRSNMHLLPQENRQDLVWGAFSIVNATLQCMQYATNQLQLHFDYAIDVSGTTYPVKSNRFIRETLAAEPNTFFMETYYIPARPEPHMWHQFVECDGALHRIARMPLIKGINMFLGSQWFAVPRHFVSWLLTSALPRDYCHYAQYIIVADENYFSTMFFNSPYCQDNLRKTLLYQVFDKWEHERNDSSKPRDTRKCLGLGEDSCGRSPSTLTMEYKYLLSSSRALFARKFDPTVESSMQLVDFLDEMRGTGVAKGTGKGDGEYTDEMRRWDYNEDDQGKRVMIRAGTERMHKMRSADYKAVCNDTDDAVGACTATADTEPTLLPAAEPGTKDTTKVQAEVGFAGGQHFNAVFGGDSSSSSSGDSSDSDNSSGAIADDNEALSNVLGSDEQHNETEGRCITYLGKDEHFMALQPCDPSNAMQWFEIGRCTPGYEVVLRDGQCPLVQRVKPTTSSSSSSIEDDGYEDDGYSDYDDVAVADDSQNAFCSIYTKLPAQDAESNSQQSSTTGGIGGHWGHAGGAEGPDICMDISGESARYGTGVIGYECTGKWNQLFYLGDNCTISAVQPAIIGRVRGYEENQVVTVCLENTKRSGDVIVSGECAHLKDAHIQQHGGKGSGTEEPYETSHSNTGTVRAGNSDWEDTAGSIVTEDSEHDQGIDDADDTSFAAMLRRQMRAILTGTNGDGSDGKDSSKQNKNNSKKPRRSRPNRKRMAGSYAGTQQFEFISAN